MAAINRISNELESIVSFIQTSYPTARIERQFVPLELTSHLFVVKYENGFTDNESGGSLLHERYWEITYFGETPLDVLDTMSDLEFQIKDHYSMIPIATSSRFLRVEENISVSEVFPTNQEDLFGAEMSLMTQSRELKTITPSNPITNVSTNIQP